MSEERKIPVLINGDHSNVVGWLILSDKISDQEVSDCSISWGTMGNEKLMDMSLIPRLRVKIENDPPGPNIPGVCECGANSWFLVSDETQTIRRHRVWQCGNCNRLTEMETPA